ncbi:MAG: cyclohydrolase [Alphaproteobacteria bacterium]|nr:cyclohydrolase [Alphaproteobacteria bacterium]
MPVVRNDVGSSLFGTKGRVGVNRGVAEFHAGRPVLVTGGGETLLTLPIEGLDAQRLAEFMLLCAPVLPRLVITARRALALGIGATTPVALPLTAGFDADDILALVTDAKIDRPIDVKSVGPAATAAIQLVKLSQGLPAVLVADIAASDATAAISDFVTVDAQAVARFGEELIQSLTIANKASVPLASGQRACFYVFRDAMGGSQVAVVVGAPDFSQPVLVRLHSACLTGDVFGSRRCDCGDQLKLALKQIEEAGGGVVLYLAQEGRGLGLANKMRTYQMQDDGLDTVDANTTLGFDNDERDYGIAARMLQMLGCNRVVLLTNNPVKLEGLAKSGIEVLGRRPLEAPINPDNYRYLTAKATRAGHLLDHRLPPPAKSSDA